MRPQLTRTMLNLTVIHYASDQTDKRNTAMMRLTAKTATVVALTAATFLVGCSSGEDSDSETKLDPTTTRAVATTTTPEVVTYQLGQPATNGGVTLTVDQVSTPATIPMMSNSMKKDSPYAVYEDVPPQAGGKFIRLDVTVENSGQTSMDLTCGWPIEAFAADSTNRMFDPVDDLYKLQGTPGCNDQLQPGFTSPMTYVFEVPQAANVRIFGFADTELNPQDPALVIIGS